MELAYDNCMVSVDFVDYVFYESYQFSTHKIDVGCVKDIIFSLEILPSPSPKMKIRVCTKLKEPLLASDATLSLSEIEHLQ